MGVYRIQRALKPITDMRIPVLWKPQTKQVAQAIELHSSFVVFYFVFVC